MPNKHIGSSLDEVLQQENLRKEIEKSIMNLLSDGVELSYTEEGIKNLQNAVWDICVKNDLKFPFESELIEIDDKPFFRIKLTDMELGLYEI